MTHQYLELFFLLSNTFFQIGDVLSKLTIVIRLFSCRAPLSRLACIQDLCSHFSFSIYLPKLRKYPSKFWGFLLKSVRFAAFSFPTCELLYFFLKLSLLFSLKHLILDGFYSLFPLRESRSEMETNLWRDCWCRNSWIWERCVNKG